MMMNYSDCDNFKLPGFHSEGPLGITTASILNINPAVTLSVNRSNISLSVPCLSPMWLSGCLLRRQDTARPEGFRILAVSRLMSSSEMSRVKSASVPSLTWDLQSLSPLPVAALGPVAGQTGERTIFW